MKSEEPSGAETHPVKNPEERRVCVSCGEHFWAAKNSEEQLCVICDARRD